MEGVSSLEVIGASKRVMRGVVGVPPHEKQASYVLVDARNAGDIDLEVTLSGTLNDSGGREVASLRPEVLVIPGHGQRTFALVSSPPRAVADGVDAKVAVTRSKRYAHPPSVVIEDGHVFSDQGRVVVTGRAVNKREGRVRAVVIGAFYDADKSPMERTFTTLQIDGGQSHAIRFVGPLGSKSAYLFLGDAVY